MSIAEGGEYFTVFVLFRSFVHLSPQTIPSQMLFFAAVSIRGRLNWSGMFYEAILKLNLNYFNMLEEL